MFGFDGCLLERYCTYVVGMILVRSNRVVKEAPYCFQFKLHCVPLSLFAAGVMVSPNKGVSESITCGRIG